MKRVLSLMLAFAMILSMVPNVFATETGEDQLPSDAGTMGSEANPEVLSDLGWVDLTLVDGDTDGYYYSYTAEEAGSITVYFSSITAAVTDEDELPVQPLAEGEEESVTGDIVLTNKTSGEVLTLSEDGVDNYGLELTMEVAAEDVVLIQVTASAAADITWVGSFAYPAGSEQNPIYPEWTWNEAQTEATATVTAPVGTTYYAVYGAGMILTINGEEYGVLTASGMGRAPAVFTITNEGEAEAEYSLKIAYPAGHQMNPEQTELGWVDVSLEANDMDGHYYTYTAEGDGTVTAYISTITEGVTGDIVLYNTNTYVQKSLSADGVDNNGLEVSIEVNAGDVLSIQVLALPDANYNYPAADITWVASFAAVLGSELNPIYPEFVMNDEWTEGTATVTVPAQTTYYFATYNTGMILTINGEEYGVLTASGMGRAPAVFSITNDTDAEATYELKLTLPLGNQMNPEKTELGQDNVSLEANDFDGYYYTYTAEADGTVTAYISAITEGVTGDIILYNLNTYVQKTLSADGVDGKVTIEVNAGDVLSIQVLALPDANYNYPAADITWVAEFTAADAPVEDPIVITQQPADQCVKVKTQGVFTVVAEGEGLTYQWQQSKDGVTWTNCGYTGSKTASMAVTCFTSRNNMQFHCVITDANGNTVTSEAATLSILVEDFRIITEPVTQDATIGDQLIYTVVANDAYAYTWQYRNGEDAEWVNAGFSGYNTDTLQLKLFFSRVNFQFRCIVTDPLGNTLTTQVVGVNVVADPVTINAQPADVIAGYETTARFSVDAENVVAYRWEISKDGGQTWEESGYDGYNAKIMSINALVSRDTWQFRCKLTDGHGVVQYTEAATLYVAALTVQPQNQYLNSGEMAVFTVDSNYEVEYNWQYSTDGGQTWLNSGYDGYATNEMTIKFLNSRDGWMFRCAVIGTNGIWAYSKTAVMLKAVNFTAQPQSVTVASGSKAVFTVTAEKAATYAWQVSKDGGETWATAEGWGTGFDTAELTVTALSARSGWKFRCMVVNEAGSIGYSDVATLTVG